MIVRCLTTALIIAATAFASEPVVLQTLSGKIFGTLEVAGTKAPSPLVLIIAGSGPTDRDGNTRMLGTPNNSLKMLAEALRARGISSLRYDKRGIGQSSAAMGKEADIRFDNYVDDAVQWVNQLGKDKRFSHVLVAGHSEGSLIGLACAEKTNVAGVISIAGAGRPAFDLIDEQVKGKLPAGLDAEYQRIMATLREGKTVDNVSEPLVPLVRPSVQPYMISWQKYDPAKIIGKLKVPVLILQGTTDVQVKVTDARLLSAAAPSAKLVIIDGMNHIMKDVPEDRAAQMKSYGDASLAIDGKLVAAVVEFVGK